MKNRIWADLATPEVQMADHARLAWTVGISLFAFCELDLATRWQMDAEISHASVGDKKMGYFSWVLKIGDSRCII